jgi:hypothetical protein
MRQLQDQYQSGNMSYDKFKEIDWDLIGWKKAGENIEFKRSKVNQLFTSFRPRKDYSQLSFTYDFQHAEEDTTYFSYCFPYSFTKLHNLLSEFRNNPFLRSFY